MFCEKNEIQNFFENTQNCFAYISATKYRSEAVNLGSSQSFALVTTSSDKYEANWNRQAERQADRQMDTTT